MKNANDHYLHVPHIIGGRNSPGPDLLSQEEAAAALNISVATLRRWRSDGIISALRLGRRIFFRFKDIEALLVPEKVMEE